MPVKKAAAPVKKAVAAKTAAKAPAKKRVSKGEKVECEVCGLVVSVEEIGGIAVAEETTLLCCGKPMKSRKAPVKAKAAALAKAKTKAGK
jgi:hypothetical protein